MKKSIAVIVTDPHGAYHEDGFTRLDIIRMARTFPYFIAECMADAQKPEEFKRNLLGTFPDASEAKQEIRSNPLMEFIVADYTVNLYPYGTVEIATPEAVEFFNLNVQV